MPRHFLGEDRLHADIRERVSAQHRSIVDEVEAALATHPIVVVGMRGNPFCRRARRTLANAGMPFDYLEYGGYLSQWRRRNALKMWTGWATFPMVFVRGQLIGGSNDLARLIDSGELPRLLA